MKELEVLGAFDEKLIERIPMQDEATCLAALERAHALYSDRDAWLPAHERLSILERVAELIRQRTDELAKQAAREGGKPLGDSLVEVRRAAEGVSAAITELHGLAGRQIPMGTTASSTGRLAWTWREPRGVVLAISAFNHPFNLIVHQVVPALAVGCPVLVKPATTTPLSCRSLVRILHEAGLPEAWCQMVVCDNEVASKLVTDSRTAFLTFIGSARVGWFLRSQLPPGAACALEHGGVAPAIVEPSADLDWAIPKLLKGGFYHAGQVCVSVQRIYVHRSVLDSFVERFVEGAKKLVVGDPTAESTEVGPLILPREVERVHEWVREAVDGGAKLLCGGEKVGSTCYAPTVLLDPPEDSKVSLREVFGPVVAIYGYDDRKDAVARANAPDTYFQASVFTRDLEAALGTFQRLNGMAIMVNDHTAFRVDWMPFGGHRSSGLGVGGIGYSMHEMSIERMVVFHSPSL